MRVAFITAMTGAPWGGSEELWSRAALLAKQSGHDVTAGVYEWDTEPGQLKTIIAGNITVFKVDRNLNLPKRIYKRVWEQATGRRYKQLYQKFLDKVSKFAPDVLCVSQGGTFNISAIEGLYNFLTATTIPFVIICQHNQEIGGNLNSKQAYFEKKLFDSAKKVLFVAQRNKDTAERQLASEIKNGAVIGNPLNIPQSGIMPYILPAEPLNMACVARLETIAKGQDILLQALSTETWRSRNFHLNLYGSGPDQEYLVRLIDFYGIGSKVTLHGHVNSIEDIWRKNQLLILPSVSEGTPLSLVEAMLCGRPAVATDVGGVARYVLDGETGFLAPFATVNALSTALEKLWQNRHTVNQMGEKAHQHALSITDMQPEHTLLNILIGASADNAT